MLRLFTLQRRSLSLFRILEKSREGYAARPRWLCIILLRPPLETVFFPHSRPFRFGDTIRGKDLCNVARLRRECFCRLQRESCCRAWSSVSVFLWVYAMLVFFFGRADRVLRLICVIWRICVGAHLFHFRKRGEARWFSGSIGSCGMGCEIYI